MVNLLFGFFSLYISNVFLIFEHAGLGKLPHKRRPVATAEASGVFVKLETMNRKILQGSDEKMKKSKLCATC